MDIRCSKCGEPWDVDSLHDLVAEEFGHWDPIAQRTVVAGDYSILFERVRHDFKRRGCEAFGARHNETKAHPGIAEIQDLLGDDIDGAAALIEDFEAAGLFD